MPLPRLARAIAATGAVTGSDFQLGLRLSPERYGVPLDDARTLAADVMSGGSIVWAPPFAGGVSRRRG